MDNGATGSTGNTGATGPLGGATTNNIIALNTLTPGPNAILTLVNSSQGGTATLVPFTQTGGDPTGAQLTIFQLL
ncbi:hypothetical protein [Bacillus toyonensis]|uniref:Uncharacterized protein n=2 Tax=Bacillus toyonensis TaxID=155322 RepID=A0A2A8H7U2_9BACI|nr:hypothetical protein [Bacillus toyonensis]PEP91822.1 hypothetical protein CN585_27770 [Bacillus toyonensis]